MAYLYRHIRLDKNEPFYIGIGGDEEGNYERAYHNGHYRNKHWKNIVAQSPYEVEILLDNLTWDEACNKEIEFIELYGRNDLKQGSLCNMTNGGDGCKGLNRKGQGKGIKKPSLSLKLLGNQYWKNRDNKAMGTKISLNQPKRKNHNKPILQIDPITNTVIKEWIGFVDLDNSEFKGVRGAIIQNRPYKGFIWIKNY
jgi:hypothetical protein